MPCSEATASSPGRSRLGWALACGDFDADGFDDLAAGLPGRSVNGLSGAGRILVWPGSPTGVGPGVYGLDQDSTDMAGVAEAGDAFGTQLTVGDFDGDFRIDLAVAVPMEVLLAGDPVGVVQVIYGSPAGLTGDDDQIVVNPDPAGDLDEGSFGNALAAGSFNGDPFDDLLVGSPGDDADAPAGGAVYLFRGSPVGFNGSFARFSPDELFEIGDSEPLDSFGYALAARRLRRRRARRSSRSAIRGRTCTGNADGAVRRSSPARRFSCRPAPVRSSTGSKASRDPRASTSSQFGQALAAGDFDGDGHADLAIGAPIESEAGLPQVGDGDRSSTERSSPTASTAALSSTGVVERSRASRSS